MIDKTRVVDGIAAWSVYLALGVVALLTVSTWLEIGRAFVALRAWETNVEWSVDRSPALEQSYYLGVGGAAPLESCRDRGCLLLLRGPSTCMTCEQAIASWTDYVRPYARWLHVVVVHTEPCPTCEMTAHEGVSHVVIRNIDEFAQDTGIGMMPFAAAFDRTGRLVAAVNGGPPSEGALRETARRLVVPGPPEQPLVERVPGAEPVQTRPTAGSATPLLPSVPLTGTR